MFESVKKSTGEVRKSKDEIMEFCKRLKHTHDNLEKICHILLEYKPKKVVVSHCWVCSRSCVSRSKRGHSKDCELRETHDVLCIDDCKVLMEIRMST